jgi:hypothetical protein
MALLYVRWKPYGFTHLVEEEKVNEHGPMQPRYDERPPILGRSVCGNEFHIMFPNKRYFAHQRLESSGVPQGKLAPSKEDDNKRPLCGTCRRRLEKENR